MFRITALAVRHSERTLFKKYIFHPIKVPEICHLSHKTVATTASNYLKVSQYRVSINILYSFICRKYIINIKRSSQHIQYGTK